MKALEEEAALEGLKTLWKSAKLEVESVIRELFLSRRTSTPDFAADFLPLPSRPFRRTGETCDRLLADPKLSKEKLRLRAVALELMGEVRLVFLFHSLPSPPYSPFIDLSSLTLFLSPFFPLPSFNQAYMSVKKENDPAAMLQEEFVKVDTKASKEREANAHSHA